MRVKVLVEVVAVAPSPERAEKETANFLRQALREFGDENYVVDYEVLSSKEID